MTLRLDTGGLDAWLDGFAVDVGRAMARRMEARVGPLFKTEAQRITKAQAYATGSYYDKFRHEPYTASGVTAGRALVNDAPYMRQLAMEHGRRAGQPFPPERARADILKWMQLRGIPEEKLFIIRRAIAERGTVKRLGYKGFLIFEQTYRATDEQIFALLDEAYAEVLRSG